MLQVIVSVFVAADLAVCGYVPSLLLACSGGFVPASCLVIDTQLCQIFTHRYGLALY